MEFLKKLLKISLLFGVATLSFLFTNFNQPEKVQAQTCPTSEQVILSVSATPTTVNKGEKLTDSVKMTWKIANTYYSYINNVNIRQPDGIEVALSELDWKYNGRKTFSSPQSGIYSLKVYLKSTYAPSCGAYKSRDFPTITVNNISCAISPTLSFSSATIAENGSTTLNYNKGSSSSYYQVRRGTSPGSISNAGIILPNQSGSISISAYSPVSHILNTLYYYDLLVNANTTYCNDRNSTDATFKVTPICPTVSSFTIPAIVYKNQTTSVSWNINNYYGAVSAQIVVKDNTTGLNIDTVNVASASGTATIDVKKVVYIVGRSYTATLSTTKSGCSGSSLSTTFQVKNPSPTVDTFTATSSINSGEKKVDPITFNWTTTGADNVTIQYRNSSSVWTDLVTNRGADSSYSFTPTTTHIVSNAVKTRIIAKKASAADAIFPQPPDTGRTTSVTAISCVRTPTLSINANTINENGTATLTYNTNGSIASPATAKIERKIWTTGAWGEAFGVTTLSSTANSTKQTYPALTHTFGSTYYYRLLANANTTYCNDKTTADNSVPLTVNKICPTSTAVTLTPSTSNPTGKSVDRDTNLTIGYTVQNAYGDVAYDLKIKEKTGFIKQVLYNLPITASINTATKVATGSYSVIPNTITSLLLNTDYDLIFSASRNSVSCPSVSITQVFRVTVQSPTISSFTANPTSVQIGDDSTKYQSSALNWSATNAETMKIEAYNVTTSSWGLVYTIPSNQFAGGPHSLQPTDSVINRTTKKIQLRVVATRMNALDAIKTLDIPITLVSCPTQAGTTIIADDATIRKPGGTTIRWSSINDPDSIVISYLTPQNTFPRGNAKNPSGSQWVEPTSDVTYTNTTKKAYCSDKTASVFIKVLEPCPKVDYFRFKNYASTTKEITPGELVTIEWNITNNPSQIQHTINNGTSWSDVTATGSYSWNAYSGGIVKMRYKRSDCNSGNWQESGLLTLNIVAPPQAPTINGPNDGTEFNAKPANGIFNWSNVSSEGYIIDIYQTSNNSINPIDDRSVSSTSFSWSDTDWGSLSDTAYSWRVRANSSKFTVANDGHWVNLTTNEKMVSYPKAWSTPRNFVKLTSLGSFGITSPASGTVKAMPPEIIWTSSDFATSYTIKFTDTTNSSVVLSQDIDSAGFLARRWTIPLGDWKDKFVIDRNYNIQVIAKRNTLTRNNGSGQQTLIKKELLLECKKYIDLPTLLNNEKSGSCETDLSYNHKPLFNWYSQSSPTSILGQMPPEITPIEVKWVKGATTYTHILSSDDIANGKYTPPTDMWRSLEAGLDWTVTMYAKWNGQVVIQSNPYTIRVPIENPDLVSPISKIYYSKPADTEFMWTDSRTDQTYQIYFYKDGSTTQSFILSTTVNGQTYLPWTTSAWDAVPNGNYKIKVKRTNDPVIYMSDEGSFTKAQLTAPVFSSTVPNGSMFFQTAPANNTYKWNSVTNASDYIVQLKKGDSSFSSNNVSEPLKNTTGEKEIVVSGTTIDFNAKYNGRATTLWSELDNGLWYMRVAGRVYSGQKNNYVWSNVLYLEKQTPNLTLLNSAPFDRELKPQFKFDPQALPDDLEVNLYTTAGPHTLTSINIGRKVVLLGKNKIQLDNFSYTEEQWRNIFYGSWQVYYIVATKADHIERARSNTITFSKDLPSQTNPTLTVNKTTAMEQERVKFTLNYPRSEVAFDHALPSTTLSPFITTNSLELLFSNNNFDLNSISSTDLDGGAVDIVQNKITWSIDSNAKDGKVIWIPMGNSDNCNGETTVTLNKTITPQFGSEIINNSNNVSVIYDCPTGTFVFDPTKTKKTRSGGPNTDNIKKGDILTYKIEYEGTFTKGSGSGGGGEATLFEKIKNIPDSIIQKIAQTYKNAGQKIARIKTNRIKLAKAQELTTIYANIDGSSHDITYLTESARGKSLILDGRYGLGGDFIFSGNLTFDIQSLTLLSGAKISGTGNLTVNANNFIKICRSCSLKVKGYSGGRMTQCQATGGRGSKPGGSSIASSPYPALCGIAGNGGDWDQGGAGGGAGGGDLGVGGGGGNIGGGGGAFTSNLGGSWNLGGGAAGVGGKGAIGVNKAINGQSGNGTSANDQLQTWLALGKKLTQGGGGGAGGGNYSGDHSINEGRFGGGIISLKTNQNGTIFTKGLISSKGDDGEYKLMGGTTNKIGAGGAGAGGSINLDAGNIYICPTDNNLKPLSMFDARGGDSGRKDYSGHSNYALRSGAGGGGLVSLKATKVIEVGDNNVGVGVKNDLQTQLNSVVAGGGNYSSVTSNKSENGIANLEIDGTTGNNDASCSDGFDETNLPDEPSVSLWVNGEDVDVTSLPSGTEINLTWTQDGANDLKLVTKVGESAETTPQDVTASTSIASFPLEDDIYFKITASNASGSTSDTVKIFQYGSTNLAKGIHIIDTPTNLVSATGESGEWDSSTQPLIFDFDESTNIFKGEVNIEYIVPSDICNKPVNERSIKNEATLIPYLGTYASNNSTDSPSTIETLPEDVQCGVSVGGNVRAHNIDDRKITFKDEIPSLLIVGEDSSLSDPGKGNIQFLKYNGLIDVDMIKKRINRLFKESAKGSPALSGSSTQTGIWRVEAGKTIAGNYSKKNTFIVKNADDSITIDNLNALQSVGIIAKDTNINIEGINKNIAIFAYDTDTLDDICDVDGNCKKNKGNVTFIGGDDINFTGAIVAESISLGDKTGNIDWSSQLQTYVPEGFSEILSPLISEKAP